MERMNLRDTAAYLGVSHTVIYRFEREGLLSRERVNPLYKRADVVYYSRAEVEAIKRQAESRDLVPA